MRRQDNHSSNKNNNLLQWIQTKISKFSSFRLRNRKRVGNHSVEFIDVPIANKPLQNNRPVSANSNREKFDSMMRILRSPIAFGYLQAYLMTEEENKCQYLKFYLACKDLTDRHQNFTISVSNGPGQLELFQFRQKARVMNIWNSFFENVGDDGLGEGGGRRSHFQQSLTPSEKATSPVDEEASNSSSSQQQQQQHHQRTQDVPSEEISKPTHVSVRMANAIHSISRSQSEVQKYGTNGPPSTKSRGGIGPVSSKSGASKQFNAPYVVSSSDKGPGRLALPVMVVDHHHTFLPSKVIRNVRFKMEQPNTTWGPELFTEALDAALVILHDDVFPRFRQSRYFTKMMHREKYIFDDSERYLPHAHNLQVRPPRSQIVELLALGSHSEESTMSQYAGRHYSLEEIMEDGMLYEELLSHLKKSHSADSLLCIRMITIFKELLQKAVADKHPLQALSSSSKCELFDALESGLSIPVAGGGGGGSAGGGDKRRSASMFFDKSSSVLHASVDEQAWLIYCYFVAVGSCYEIAIAPKCREAVMMSLVVPHLLMFAELEASAYADLSSQFRDYKNTVSYELMGRRAVTTAISRAHGVSMSQKAVRALSIGPLKKYPVAASSVIVNKDLSPRSSGL